MSAPATGRSVSADLVADEWLPLVDALARAHFAAEGEGLATWDERPEPERLRHVRLARQMLQAIAAAGYAITRPPDGSAAGGWSHLEPTEALVACRQQAERLLRGGEPLLAYNTVQQGLDSWPGDLRLRQLQSLALARSGAVQRANQGLQKLVEEGHADGETLGLLARTHKDLGTSSSDPGTRQRHLTAAHELYGEAYQRARRLDNPADAYYTGINAATTALLLGDVAHARLLARQVRELCLGELEQAQPGGDYWLRATLAEAALVLDDFEEAESQYVLAAKTAGSRHGDLASTRRQARLLLAQMGRDERWLARVLEIPPVLVFTGHRVSAPGQPGPFPAELETAVRDEIRCRLDRVRPLAAYGSAACGADILCLEAMLERGGEIHVTLPFPAEEFRRASVDTAPGWSERFERVLAAARSVVVASDFAAEGSSAEFEYANLILTGAARLRARMLGTGLVGLAVWDGRPARGRGGTGDVVALWQRCGLALEHVDLARLRGEPQAVAVPAPPDAPPAAAPSPVGGLRHEIKAMLFADAVGYSKLTENQIPIFIEHFLGAVGSLNRTTRHRPINMQTAGDGLYFVFDDTASAGHYALELNAMVRGKDWTALGLPPSFDLRVGLHCGPIFCSRDPVTGEGLYTGSHTSRTARIEPITPPGQVYTSSAFAAVAAATGVDDLVFSYIGRIPLAKHYGSLSLYHVQRP